MMSSILEDHCNNYLEYDINNYEIYKIMLRRYLINKTKNENISDNDLYEYAKKEYKNRFNKELQEKMNEDFKKNTWGLSKEELDKVVSLIAKIYVGCINILPIDIKNLNGIFSIENYSKDYYKCLEKVIIGFELQEKKLSLLVEDNRLKFKMNN